MNLTNDAFSKNFPVSPLHWMLSDNKESIVVEPVKGKVTIYDNPTGVLTNKPTFDKQLFNLNNFHHLSPKVSDVKVAFTKLNAVADSSEASSVNQFFHILKSVEQQKGLCYVDESDGYEYTIYSSCMNADKEIYYYTTYEDSQVTAVDMHQENLDSSQLIRYPLQKEWNIFYQNK